MTSPADGTQRLDLPASCDAGHAVQAAQPQSPAIVRIEPAGDLASLRDVWTELAQRSGNLFATWEWAGVWWRHYGEGADPLPLACLDAHGRTVAILALCIERVGPMRVARFIGHGPADELGPVCAAADVEDAVAALQRAPQRWNVLLAERLPGTRAWARALAGTELHHEASPVVDVAGLTWDEYLAGRSSNFRSQVRRKERKLVREHGLEYRLCDDRHRLEADMGTLFDLHRRRWEDGDSDAFDGARAAFHRDFAALALERGWLRLWLAEIEGRAVAAWYGFRYGGSEWYYQFGRDPEWDRSSIGLVLLAHTLREAIGDGVDRYRLLRGGEPYKDRFATSDLGLVTVAVPRGPSGRAAVSAARVALRLPAGARRRVTMRLG